ncbi:GNAT family N-acetyltransferase [Sorangium sp. So ce185]|uniref:GNAT family N-acetyltransferase n=1 Tax=Sorangium sp. So ce185 TaxID=3133287 RepID=UPI003F638BC7
MDDHDSPIIRAARPEDAELLGALARRSKAHWGYSPEFLEACRAELSISPAYIAQHPTFVLARGDDPLGFYTLEALSSTAVELGHLFVEPAEIGRSLGRALLSHAREEARRRGYRVLVIQSDPNAARFYEACGARRVGERRSASIPGRLLPLFELDLSG